MPLGTRQTPNANATSRKGMVATPHWRATEAGAAVLARGGNAVEALVAAGAALSVLYPHFCGLGGDAVWMVADRSGAVKTFLGIGQAARNVEDIETIPVRGAGSMLTTACLVDSWDSVLAHSSANWAGTETLASLLDDAIALADQGFEVSPSQRFWHEFRQLELADWHGFSSTFVGQGRQRQPDLARTLERVASKGAREFYEGELGLKIATGLAAAGSRLTASDLAATKTRVADLVSLKYRDMTLFAPPPPTQGVTTLGIMGVLEHFAMGDFAPSSAGYYHHLVEAVKQAFLDRHRIGDPDFTDEDVSAALLDHGRLAGRAGSIDPLHAMAWPHVYQHGDTSFLAATDSEGRSACVLQSIYFDWGSGVVVGDTGLLWQNRGAAFSTDSASANRLAPGKRPFYTLNPGMALRDGVPHLLYGTQGADGQPQTLALLLSLLIDHGLNPLAALSRPRFLLGKTFSDGRDTLKLEDNIGRDVMTELSRMAHDVSPIAAFSPLAGQAGVIRITSNGRIEGAHDPRSDGGAIGL